VLLHNFINHVKPVLIVVLKDCDMKDLLGREVQVGHYICYALTVGRSANLAVYQVKEVLENKIKAVKLESSYGHWGNGMHTFASGLTVPWKHVKWDKKLCTHVEMTEEEKAKVDNKTSTLSMPERIFIIDGFTPGLLQPNNT